MWSKFIIYVIDTLKIYRPRAVPLTGNVDNGELYIACVATIGQGQWHWGCDI